MTMADQDPAEGQPMQNASPAPAPDAMSDADKIRAKRLAKLGAPSPASPSSSTTPTFQPEPKQPPQSSASKSPVPAPSTSAQNPFTALGMSAENKPPARINIKPKAAAPTNQDVDIATWTDRFLSNIFRISLDNNFTRDAHGHNLYVVRGVQSDLENEGAPLRFTLEVLDQTILESASSGTQGKPLDYLLECWKRVSRQFRGLHNKADPKYGVVKEARRLCFNYCIFAASMPDMFGVEDTTVVNPLVEHLLVDGESDRGLCHDFITEAVSRFDDEEDGADIKALLVEAVEQLSLQLSKLSMNGDYKPYMNAMRSFVRYPPLLVAMSQSSMFLPVDIQAPDIETHTLLGPFFRLSPMQPEVALNYFSSPTARDKGYIANSQKALRMTLQTHQDELFDIANCFIKSSKSREKMLDWFALTVNKNHKRRAIQVQNKEVASDGFMVNVTIVLDRLCEPFMDATFSKIDRIDINYLRRSPRVRIDDETKINADQHESDDFYNSKVEGTNNFITEIFFLTVAAHHYGTEAVNTKLSQMQKDVKWMQKQLDKMETERHKYLHNQGQLHMFDQHVKKIKDQIERSHCTIFATEGVLQDDIAQSRSMQFLRYVIVWLLRLVSPGTSFPQQSIQLPLLEEQPLAFKCLPEYFLEDIVDNFKFITRYMPHIVTSTQCEELVAICITFLRNTDYVRNPYLKSGLVTILFSGVWPWGHRSKGILGDVLFAHKFATEHLLHALMRFYIECESTGTHNQFYDKFNIRYEIFQVIKCIWPNPIYRENLATEARVNLDFFVQFVNLLLNDVTFVLDESFTAFTQIHEVSNQLKEPPSNADDNWRQEQEEKLSAAKSKAQSYMSLTNETVSMLKLFTEALGDSFTKPEVVQRLAHMLDYNLEALVGARRSKLKVEEPEKYGWNPKQMLAEITDVFLNLREKESFVTAVATDGRSYKPENFDQALHIMTKHALKSGEQLRDWADFSMKIREKKEEADMEEADLGEIPDEFLDPILATLMEDPVLLPTSKSIVDRSTIRGHLLSDGTDPFNRQPLKIEAVIPQDALRQEILKWKEDTLKKKMAERQAATQGEAMDTS